MTKRTRYFLTGSTLVLILGLCTGLVAYYNGGLPLSSSDGPRDLSYLPSDSAGVGFVKVQEIMNSEFRQKLRQLLPTGEEKDKLLAETGIDLERDIDTVVAGFTGTEPSAAGALVLVRGRLNNGHIEALAVQHGGTAEEYKGTRLVLMKENHGEAVPGTPDAAPGAQTTACIAFLDAGLVAMGDSATVKRAIDAHASGDNITKNADVMKFISDIEGQNNAWIVGRFDTIGKPAGLPEAVTDQMAAVKWFSVSAQVDGGVSGVIRAEARDDKSAENLRDVVRGGLAAARLIGGQDVKVDALLNSLQLTGTGKTVAVSFRVSPEMLDIINGIAGVKNLVAPSKGAGK